MGRVSKSLTGTSLGIVGALKVRGGSAVRTVREVEGIPSVKLTHFLEAGGVVLGPFNQLKSVGFKPAQSARTR